MKENVIIRDEGVHHCLYLYFFNQLNILNQYLYFFNCKLVLPKP